MATIDPGVLTDFNYQSEEFQDTLQAEIVDKLGLTTSGIMVDGSNFIQNKMGDFAHIPQYQTLADAMTQVVTVTDVDINDFADYKMTMPWIQREGAWGVESIVQTITGKDPLTEIARQFANKIAQTMKTSAINMLKGCFATALSATHSTGTSYSGNNITFDGVRGAKQLLGDSQMLLTRAVANSKVVNDAGGLVGTTFPNTQIGSQTLTSGIVPNLYGIQAWMDDSIASVASIYSTYIAAPGAVIYALRPWSHKDLNGNQVTSPAVNVEYQRVPQTGGGQDRIYLRVSYTVLLNGMQFSISYKNPTDAQLATGAYWTKVADDNRKIKCVELKTA